MSATATTERPATDMALSDKMLVRKEGRVGTMIFNNPERHNAVSLEMWDSVRAILDDFAADPEITVVVITGAGGKAFVSGADISKFGDERANKEAVAHYNTLVERAYTRLHEFPKPTIAMIRGYCIGGGLGLAIACDLRICSDNSRFALPAAKLSLGYGYNGLKRFIDLVGPGFTKEIFYTARQFTAAEAQEMGLVNRVVPEAELETYVRDYAATIAGNAPLTLKAVKIITNEILKEESKRDLARCTAAVQECFDSQDYIEGRDAFLQKRKPVFKGK
jgi:enoyl-CoA hydratase/carnithine racemase